MCESKGRIDDWIRQDWREDVVQSLRDRLAQPGSEAELAPMFVNRLEFGTAGLRGVMKPYGYNCMNDLTVYHAGQGIALYLLNKFGKEEAKSRGIIVGFDGRHNSKRFAHVTAAVFLGYGFKVALFSDVTMTPLTPYGVVKRKFLVGIQVTASHNPKQDNGYKVYGWNGAQIIPPMDVDVFDLIKEERNDRVGIDLLCSTSGLLKDVKLTDDLYAELFSEYIKELGNELSSVASREVTKQSPLKIVYTAMHGVGYPFVEKILREIGFRVDNQLKVVEEQKLPDPEFSTVPFPNPEEKGALNLAMALAEREGAPIVIANDPDADRFACAERQADGKWHVFHGDELGILFGVRLFEQCKVPKEKQLYICSAVSSRMLQKMAVTEGTNFTETMTGFKWMMNEAISRKESGFVPILTYEEALGYAVSMSVPDKDGVSASAVWVQMACELYAGGNTILGKLNDFRRKYGFFVTNNSYYLCHDKNVMNQLFAEFRNEGKYHDSVGEFKIARIRDVTTGFDSATIDKKCAFPLSPAAQMITIFFENLTVLTVRTSGTEPKIKWYAELPGTDPVSARTEVDRVVGAFIKDVLQPQKFPLVPAPTA